MSSETRPSARTADAAYEQLLGDIQSGALPAGSVLAEAEQAERLGVSRTPVREAIQRLVAAGLALHRSPRVTVVSQVDEQQVRQLFEARRAIEEACIRAAARDADPARFADLARRLRESRERLVAGEGFEDYSALIREFDEAVDGSVGNEFLLTPLRSLRLHLKRIRRMALSDTDRLIETVAEHAQIAEAIADGDQERAVHAAHLHFHAALMHTLRQLHPAQVTEE